MVSHSIDRSVFLTAPPTPVTCHTFDCYFCPTGEVHDMFCKAGLDEKQNLVDHRLQVNRKKQVKMHRVWVQGKFQKPLHLTQKSSKLVFSHYSHSWAMYHVKVQTRGLHDSKTSINFSCLKRQSEEENVYILLFTMGELLCILSTCKWFGRVDHILCFQNLIWSGLFGFMMSNHFVCLNFVSIQLNYCYKSDASEKP